jgi:hypothetical protein
MPEIQSLTSAQQKIYEQNVKVFNDEVRLTKLILADDELMEFSANFLSQLKSDSEIDNQLIIFLDRFVIKAEEFCSKNNVDLDAAFFNILMFACVYKNVGKSNDEIAKLREQLLIRQHVIGDSLDPDKDLKNLSEQITKKVLLMSNGFSTIARRLPTKTKDEMAQEGLAMTFGFYNNVLAGIGSVLQVQSNPDINEQEYENVESFMDDFVGSMLKGINKAIELNNPYITQVNVLMSTINTVMWKLSFYMVKWLIPTRKHSKQDEVDTLFQRITDIFYEDDKKFDPRDKCQRVIVLIEECLMKIKNSVTKNGDINTKNKTKLFALVTDVLNDLHLVEDTIRHVEQPQHISKENNKQNEENHENHFFQRYSNVNTIMKPRDVAEKSLFQIPIDKIREERKKASAAINGFFMKLADKLTFGLVALAMAAFKGDALLKEWNKENNAVFKRLPDPIKLAGGIDKYLTNLKPKSLIRIPKKTEDGKVVTEKFRVLHSKKPQVDKEENFDGLNALSLLTDRNHSDKAQVKNVSYDQYDVLRADITYCHF